MSYRWRDPARITPGRRAELEARDRPEPPAGREWQAAARAERIRRYAQLRAPVADGGEGLNKGQAATAMGISRDTARQYERARRPS